MTKKFTAKKGPVLATFKWRRKRSCGTCGCNPCSYGRRGR